MGDERDIGEIPKGFYVVWFEDSNASIMFTREVLHSYDFEEWFETLEWAAQEIWKDADERAQD